MALQFLLPQTVAREDGQGAEVACEPRLVRLILGITRMITQESLEVSVWGSSDGKKWHPVASFPKKFYCGTYSMLMDLAHHPDVRQVRAQWKMGRWLPGDNSPLFEFYVQMESGRMRREAGAA